MGFTKYLNLFIYFDIDSYVSFAYFVPLILPCEHYVSPKIDYLLFDRIYCECLITAPRNYLQVNFVVQRLNIDVVLSIL